IEEVEYRIAPGWIESGRLVQAVMQDLSIIGLDGAELRTDAFAPIGGEGMRFIQRVMLDPRGQAAIGAADADLWRRLRIAEGVDVEARIFGEGGRVAAIALADAAWRVGAAAIELERVDLGVRHEVAIGLHVDRAGFLVHREQLVDVPVAAADRMLEAAVDGIQIQVME